MTSFNHVALGAVADWLHRGRRRPRSVRARLQEDLLLSRAPAAALLPLQLRHDTPYGRVRIPGTFRRRMLVEMTDPPDGTATARLPGSPPFELEAGTHRATVPRPAAPEPVAR